MAFGKALALTRQRIPKKGKMIIKLQRIPFKESECLVFRNDENENYEIMKIVPTFYLDHNKQYAEVWVKNLSEGELTFGKGSVVAEYCKVTMSAFDCPT